MAVTSYICRQGIEYFGGCVAYLVHIDCIGYASRGKWKSDNYIHSEED